MRVKRLSLTLFHGSVSVIEVITCRTIWQRHCAQEGALTEEIVTHMKTITGSNKKIHISQALTFPEYIIFELICSNVTV